MIGQKDVPSRLGGVEIAVGALSVRMAAKGHHVTLYNCHRYNFKNRRKKLLHTQYPGNTSSGREGGFSSIGVYDCYSVCGSRRGI